jgi:hypothetical protein
MPLGFFRPPRLGQTPAEPPTDYRALAEMWAQRWGEVSAERDRLANEAKRLRTELEMERALRPWLRHVGACAAPDRTEPMDERCICGLRQAFAPVQQREELLKHMGRF